MPVSPGIYVREFDFSQYAQQLGSTTLAIIGGATQGDLNKPTILTNEADLISKFGKPLTTDYAVQSAVQYFRNGGRKMVFTRVANGSASANYPVPGTTGGSAATSGSGTVVFVASTNPADGETVTVRTRSTPYCTLQNDSVGTLGNTTITRVGANITVAGMASGTATAKATGSITLAAQPADTNTISLDDGAGGTETFEFESGGGVTPGNIAVTIGADMWATMDALVTAINAAAINITATNAASKTFEFDNNSSVGAGNIPVLIATGSALGTLNNLIAAIAANMAGLVTVQNTTVTVPQATITNVLTGLVSNAPLAKTGSGNLTVSGMAGGLDAVAGAVNTVLTATAKSPGTWGNGVQVQVVSPSAVIGATAGNFDLLVYVPVDDGSSVYLAERFSNLSLSSTSDRYVVNILTYGKTGEVAASQVITVALANASATISGGTYTLGQAPGVAGLDGITGLTSSDYIGTVSGNTATGLQALRNPETTEFNLLAIPGITDTAVINAVISAATARGDFLYLLDAPFGLDRDGVIAWHNGTNNAVPNSPAAPIASSYVALYWSWCKVEDSYNSTTIWLPPCGLVAGAMAASDNAVGPWLAVAGYTRGVLASALDVEYSPTQADRDLLEGLDTTNRVNPIIISSDGIVIFGNRTTQRKRTALDSIHIRRMLIHAEKLCATAVRVLVFDPNDAQTWRTFTRLCNDVLDVIKGARGIEEFKVICDSTTNPAVQRQNKTMRGKLLIKPVEAAEIIILDFALFATGANFDENAI
jgi:hypothetical protein